jgi:SOS-response transcriptional repressor LexA
MKEITENQKKLLSFIKDYTLKHGYQPNVQEMEIYMGVTYKAIWDTLRLLQRKGKISMTGKARALEITEFDIKQVLLDVKQYILELTPSGASAVQANEYVLARINCLLKD